MLDPDQIRFTRRHMIVRKLMQRVPRELDVPVEPETMTALVELLLVNGPVPDVTFCEDTNDSVVRVLSGARFVSALRAFADGAELGTTSWVAGWTGKKLTELPAEIQRRFALYRDVAVTIVETCNSPDVAEAVCKALSMA